MFVFFVRSQEGGLTRGDEQSSDGRQLLQGTEAGHLSCDAACLYPVSAAGSWMGFAAFTNGLV